MPKTILKVYFIFSETSVIFDDLISEDVMVFGCELVADVLSKSQGAHQEAKLEVKHGHKVDGVVFVEGLEHNQATLQNVFDELDCHHSTVPSLKLVQVD